MMPTTSHKRVAGGYHEAVRLALPLVLSMLSQTTMLAIESAMLGHFSTVDQGAAGLGAAFLWPLLLLCNCSGMGVQICVARAIGAQHRAECGVVTWQGIYLSLLVWAFLVLAGLSAPWLVQLSAPSPELLEPTALYLRIAFLGALPGLVNLTVIGFFRGLGDTKTPLLVTLVIDVLNILLDVLLIFGMAGLPRLGIAGAALAAVIATTVGTLLSLYLFLSRGQRQGFLTQRRLPFERHTCWRLVQVSWPIGAHGALEMAAWSFFTALVARLGTVEAAAHAIAVRAIALCYMAGYGISVTATTLVGRYLGAEDWVAARRSMQTCLVLLLCLMGGLGAGFFVWRQPIVRLFTNDPTAAPLAAQLLVFVALFQIFDAFNLLAMGVLRGAGQTQWPMLVGFLVNWGLFVPSVILVMFVWSGGIIAGWAIALGASIVLGLLLLWRVWRDTW